MTAARLMTKDQAKFTAFGGYHQAIEKLNKLRPRKGFFYREYSPEGHNEARVQRKYFTSANAKRIDAIRFRIRDWNEAGDLSTLEHWLLLADLIASTNQVANIAGTYGCFMSSFTPGALRPLQMHARQLRSTSPEWTVTNSDVFDLEPGQGDVPYLDPPYTKRQYAAYYHIPETIAAEDEPKVSGITGLRPWKAKSSPFCYKVKAARTMDSLLGSLDSHRILISYSSDGHIPPHEIASITERHGKTTTHRFENFGRYAPNAESQANSSGRRLTEFVFDIRR